MSDQKNDVKKVNWKDTSKFSLGCVVVNDQGEPVKNPDLLPIGHGYVVQTKPGELTMVQQVFPFKNSETIFISVDELKAIAEKFCK